MSDHEKDPMRVAAGLKAAIHNPNVSEEAKDSAAQRLQEMGADEDPKHSTESKRGGNKATSPFDGDPPEEAKAYAREVLGMAQEKESKPKSGTHNTRVLAGYKATMNNPRVSDGARAHAEEYLEEHNAL